MRKNGAEIHWMDNQWVAPTKTHPMAVSQRLSLLITLCYACTREPNITISIETSSSWCKQMQRLKNKHQALLRECCGRISVRIKWYKGDQGYQRNANRIKKASCIATPTLVESMWHGASCAFRHDVCIPQELVSWRSLASCFCKLLQCSDQILWNWVLCLVFLDFYNND